MNAYAIFICLMLSLTAMQSGRASGGLSQQSNRQIVRTLADILLDSRTTQKNIIPSLGKYIQGIKPGPEEFFWLYTFDLKDNIFGGGDIKNAQKYPGVKLWMGLWPKDTKAVFVGDLAQIFGKPILLFRDDEEPAAKWVYQRKSSPWVAVILGGLDEPDEPFPFKLTGVHRVYSIQILIKKTSTPLLYSTEH